MITDVFISLAFEGVIFMRYHKAKVEVSQKLVSELIRDINYAGTKFSIHVESFVYLKTVSTINTLK